MKKGFLLFVLLSIGYSIVGQNTCEIDKLKTAIEKFVKDNSIKVTLLSTPEGIKGYNHFVTNEKAKDKKNLKRQYRTIWVKQTFRFYLISSNKYNNNVTLKIYEGSSAKPENLIYTLNDKADNKPSFIDVDFTESTGKFLLELEFEEQKAGCSVFLPGIMINN